MIPPSSLQSNYSTLTTWIMPPPTTPKRQSWTEAERHEIQDYARLIHCYTRDIRNPDSVQTSSWNNEFNATAVIRRRIEGVQTAEKGRQRQRTLEECIGVTGSDV